MACHAPPAPPPAPSADPAAPGVRVNSLVDRYWSENYARPGEAPDISAQGLADSLASERRYLAEIAAVARASIVDANVRETYDIFLRDRQLAIEGLTYPAELSPVNPYDSEAQRFALAAVSGQVDASQKAADAFARWSAQAIFNMRQGVRRGYTLPRSTVEQMLPWLASLASDSPANPLAKSPAKAKILPAYRALHDFFKQEYLPRTRTTVGLSALPLGESWYAYLVKREAGPEFSAKTLHELGVADLEKLRTRMTGLLATTAYASNLAGFLDSVRHEPGTAAAASEAQMTAYEDLKIQIVQTLPEVVAVMPTADFSIRPVDAYAQKFALPLSYWRASPGTSGAAIIYANTADVDAGPAIASAARFLSEALPGRHLQAALQDERPASSKYRRFLGNPVFIEGWKLYAVSLGEELNVYRDVGSRVGALLVEMECAATLIVDSGLHASNWSRQQAIDYLHAQSPIDDGRAAQLVDRSIAVPAYGLGCQAAAKFHALRTQAEKFLGARFKLAEFNQALVEDGAIPLEILEVRMKNWQERQATAASDVVR